MATVGTLAAMATTWHWSTPPSPSTTTSTATEPAAADARSRGRSEHRDSEGQEGRRRDPDASSTTVRPLRRPGRADQRVVARTAAASQPASSAVHSWPGRWSQGPAASRTSRPAAPWSTPSSRPVRLRTRSSPTTDPASRPSPSSGAASAGSATRGPSSGLGRSSSSALVAWSTQRSVLLSTTTASPRSRSTSIRVREPAVPPFLPVRTRPSTSSTSHSRPLRPPPPSPATGSSAARPGARPSRTAWAKRPRSAAVVVVDVPAGAIPSPHQRAAGHPLARRGWTARSGPAVATSVEVICSGSSRRERSSVVQSPAPPARASACPSSATPRLEYWYCPRPVSSTDRASVSTSAVDTS